MHTEPPRPTDAELVILRVLWTEGASTVRHVQEYLNRVQPTGYTTVLKMLQIMTEKGLVSRDESQRAHLYRPRLSCGETQGKLVEHLLQRAFGGSATSLAMRALSASKPSAQELVDLRKLLDELEGRAS